MNKYNLFEIALSQEEEKPKAAKNTTTPPKAEKAAKPEAAAPAAKPAPPAATAAPAAPAAPAAAGAASPPLKKPMSPPKAVKTPKASIVQRKRKAEKEQGRNSIALLKSQQTFQQFPVLQGVPHYIL